MRHRIALLFVLALAACSATPSRVAMPALPNLVQQSDGIATAGAITASDIEPLHAAGIETVVDLRIDDETPEFDERAAVEAAGMKYVNVPVHGANGLTRETVNAFDAAVRNSPKPLLVHCASSNRVGAMLALNAFHVEKKSADEALTLGRAAGLKSLEPVVKGLLQAEPAPRTTPAVPVASAAAKPKNLKSAMKTIEDDWKHVEALLDGDPAQDLPGITAAAARIAAVMRLGYDTFEDKEVPNFATYAREAEAAFVDLGAKATAGDAAAIKALKESLQPQHCARCHDAVEEVHG